MLRKILVGPVASYAVILCMSGSIVSGILFCQWVLVHVIVRVLIPRVLGAF